MHDSCKLAKNVNNNRQHINIQKIIVNRFQNNDKLNTIVNKYQN